jgi:YtkA-like protein
MSARYAFRNRFSRRGSISTIAAGVAAVLLTGCMMFAGAPKGLDYSRTRVSERGLYRATIRPQGDSIPQRRLQHWTLHLETTGGAPVDTAAVIVDGGMPQHGHGLPTKPRITRSLGNGDHLVEGMKFNMGGWWVVKFRVDATAGKDSVVFNVKL